MDKANKDCNELKDELGVKDISKSICKFIGDQNELFVLEVQAALTEIDKRIKNLGNSANTNEQKKQLANEKDTINQNLNLLKAKLENVSENKDEIEKLKTKLKNQINPYYSSANNKNFLLFKIITNNLKARMEQFKNDIQYIFNFIGADGENIKSCLGGLVFCYKCGQFSNFAHNLQHLDKINSDAQNTRSIFNMKCDASGNLERGGAGLNSIGATCYINSTVQVIWHTEDLNEAFNNFDAQQESLQHNMTKEAVKVVKNLDNEEQKPYSPDDFKKALSVENPLFAGIATNDTKDLINFLIERMHIENHRAIPQNLLNQQVIQLD